MALATRRCGRGVSATDAAAEAPCGADLCRAARRFRRHTTSQEYVRQRVPRLRLFTRRPDPAGREEQFERLYLLLVDSNPFAPKITAYEVNDPTTPVDLGTAFDDLVNLLAERNFDPPKAPLPAERRVRGPISGPRSRSAVPPTRPHYGDAPIPERNVDQRGWPVSRTTNTGLAGLRLLRSSVDSRANLLP